MNEKEEKVIEIIEKYIRNANQEIVWVLEDLLKDVEGVFKHD